jgi:hypothetical protein
MELAASVGLLAIGAGVSVAALGSDETKPLVLLDQGWDASTQSRFDHESQGTRRIAKYSIDMESRPVPSLSSRCRVQYNASVRQPMDRNVGEALGVGLQTNFVDPATGQINPEPLRWKSTARIKNLYWMEEALTRLAPPPWPQAILGKVDGAEAVRGPFFEYIWTIEPL